MSGIVGVWCLSKVGAEILWKTGVGVLAHQGRISQKVLAWSRART